MVLGPSAPGRGLPRLSQALPRIGAGNNALQGLLPSPEEVAAAEEEEEGGVLDEFLNIFRIPSRLLFGESIKGALVKGGEEGILSGALEFLRNSPPVQLLDALPGVDIVNDYDFADVREAFGDDDAREGIGNIALNVLGELATDPLGTMWVPFGKLSAIGRGTAGATPASLAAATQAGKRALAVFKIPFRPTGFVGPQIKALDVPIARQLDRILKWVNTGPFISTITSKFGNGLKSGDPELDQAFKAVVESGRTEGRSWNQVMMPLVQRMIRTHPEALRNDPRMMQGVLDILQLKPEKAGELASIYNAIDGGAPFARARLARKDILSESGEAAAAASKFESLIGAEDYSAIRSLAKQWQNKHPDATLPDAVLDLGKEELRKIGVTLRPGIDTPDMFRGANATDDVLVSRALPDEVLTEGQKARAEIGKVEGSKTFQAINAVRQQQKSLFRDLAVEGKLGAVAAAAEDAREFLKTIGDHNVRAGFLRTSSELYVPSAITDPVIRESLDARWSDFFEGSKFSDMTIAEANRHVLDNGTKLTGGRPLKSVLDDAAADEEVQSTVQGVLARIFDTEFKRKLRKMGPQGRAAAELFSTNPAEIFYRAVQHSAQSREKAKLATDLFGETSPFILDEAVASDAGKIAQVLRDGIDGDRVRAFLVTPLGGKDQYLKYQHALAGDLVGGGLEVERQAKAIQAGDQLADYISSQLKGLGTLTEGAQGHLSGRGFTDLQQLETRLKNTFNLTTKDIGKLRPDSDLVEHPLYDVLRQIKDLRGEQRRLGKTIPKTVPKGLRRREIPAYLKKLEEQAEAMRQGIKFNLDAVSAAVRDLRASVKGKAQISEKQLDMIFQRKLREGAFQEEMRVLIESRRNGYVAYDELSDAQKVRLSQEIPEGKVAFMHEKVASRLFDADGAIDNLYKSDPWGRNFRLFDFSQAVWKAWTVLPPVFLQTRLRDVVTDYIMQMQGGLSPVSMVSSAGEAWEVSKAFRKSLDEGSDALREAMVGKSGPDGPISVGDLLDKARAAGVIDEGFFRDEVIGHGLEKLHTLGIGPDEKMGFFQKVFTLDAKDSVLLNNSVINSGVATAGFLNNSVRMHAVLGHYNSGKSLDEAMELVREWSFDPRRVDMSSFERFSLRRIIPFWTWFRTAVRTQTKVALTKPGAQDFWRKVHSSAVTASGMSPEEFEQSVPEFVRDNFGIPMRKDKDGLVEYALFGSFLPQADVGRAVNAIVDTFSGEKEGGIFFQVGERMSPLLKVPMELMINRSMFAQRPIEDFPGEQVNFLGINMSPNTRHLLMNVRFLNEVDRLNLLNFHDVSRMMSINATERHTRKSDSLLDALGGGAVSLTPRTVKVDPLEQAGRTSGRLRVQRNLTVHRLRRELESPTEGSEENMSALRAELARVLAKMKINGELIEDLSQ